jgi:hypothetical protein
MDRLALVVLVALVACGSHHSTDSIDAAAADAAPLDAPAGASGTAHGLFILNPPPCGLPPGIEPSPKYCDQHLVPTLVCSGADAPHGYGCTQAGAGARYVAGVVYYIEWAKVNPQPGVYDFSLLDAYAKMWTDAGKLTSFIFMPVSQGTTNKATPPWYATPSPIAQVSRTSGVIAIRTTAPMTFFPGGIAAASHLEVQITGTGTALDGGVYAVCDHATAGCSDPSAQAIYALGAGADVAAVTTGAVGNPLYGASCGTPGLPVAWRASFIAAWQDVVAHAVAHFAGDPHVGYMRFGLGLGGENIPNLETKIAACQTEMSAYGFTTNTPWPAPSDARWPDAIAPWTSYVKAMLAFESSVANGRQIGTTTSPIETTGTDVAAPDAIAAAAVAGGITIGNQGLAKQDLPPHSSCGGDWCKLFAKYRGASSLELQTILYSDPTNASATNTTGSLVDLLPLATSAGAQVVELYPDDWLCTFDPTWNGLNTYATCSTAGYANAFATAAAAITAN